MIFLAILLVGIWLISKTSNIKSALAVALVMLVLLGIAATAQA